MKHFSRQRRQASVAHAVTEWIKGGHTGKQIMIMLSLLVGICSGIAAFVLKWLIDVLKHLVTNPASITSANWRYFVFPAIGILLSALFVKFAVRDDIGHGVTKILYAISRKRGRIRPHNRWTSIIASALTIGFGGSVGAEAPIVLTGSAFGSDLGKRFHLPNSQLMLLVGCGAAGAVAAIFKAPIAGVMFVIEVLMLDLNMASIAPLLVTSLTSVCVSYALTDTTPMFTFVLDKPFSIDIIPGCILLGLVCGFVSLYFTRTMNWLEGIFGRIHRWWLKYLLGAMVLGVLIFLFPAMYGEGYDVISQLASDASPAEIMHNTLFFGDDNNLIIYLFLVLVLKVFATTATNGAGGCGGVFAPTLFLGSIAGFIFAMAWDDTLSLGVGEMFCLSPKNFALFGMAGLMSGVMHAPLTAIFLIAELTGGYRLFVPLMIVSLISYVLIRVFEPHSIYGMRLARKGQLLTHDKDQVVLTLMHIDSVIENDYVCVTPDMDLGQIVQAVIKSHRNIFPVVDGDNHFHGVITLDSMRKYIFRPEFYHQYTVQSFVKSPPCLLNTRDTVNNVLRKFEETKAWNLPVVDEDGHFLGFVSRSGLFSSYRNLIKSFSSD